MVDTQAGAKPGYKVDEGKRRMDLVPPEAIESLADVLTKGLKKYPARNWENGMDWGRVYGAAMRHMMKFWGGENVDPDSGQLHLEHALCCLAFLVTYVKRGVGQDDRHGLIEPLPRRQKAYGFKNSTCPDSCQMCWEDVR